MRWLFATAAVVCATPVHADELDDMYIEANGLTRPSPQPLAHDQIWYGWQTMSADAAFISAWALYPQWSGFKGDGALLLLDIVGYSVVSPLVDALHDNVRSESLALRWGMPLVGALLGLGIGTLVMQQCSFITGSCSDTLTWGAFDGALFGAGLAAVIDGVAFGWKTREPVRVASWTLTPFGVRGTF